MPRGTRNSRDGRNRVTSPNSDFLSDDRPRRTCTKKRKNYNEDTDTDEEIGAHTSKKRNKNGERSYGDSDIDVDIDTGLSSPFSSFSVKANDLNVANDSVAGKIFRKFPNEIHNHILSFVENDCDIISYQSVCRQTQNAVDDLVWCKRLEQFFDVTPANLTTVDENGKTQGIELWFKIGANSYKARQSTLNSRAVFNRRNVDFEFCGKLWNNLFNSQMSFLNLLKDIIYESNARKIKVEDETLIIGNNLEFLRNMTFLNTDTPVATFLRRKGVKYNDLLDSLLEEDFARVPKGQRKWNKVQIVMMTQICLASFILDPAPGQCQSRIQHFDYSQKMIYASDTSEPLFKGQYKSRISLRVVLHTLNFFKFHLKTVAVGEGIMAQAYTQLEKDQLPQMWLGKIQDGVQELKGHWKGASTYLAGPDLKQIRNQNSKQTVFSDVIDDETSPFTNMTFFSDKSQFNAEHWPWVFDQWVASKPFVNENNDPTPDGPELKYFWGSSRGSKIGHLIGCIHAVERQGEFYGWQRVAMIQFFETSGGNYNPDDIWVYEGVVLPGGRIIIGRWRQPFINPDFPDTNISGPFIFWNVDRSTVVPKITSQEAWHFVTGMNEPLFGSLPLPSLDNDSTV